MTASLASGLVILAIALWLFFSFGRRWITRGPREWIRRFDNNLCLHCGYDKRADPRGRCPECGRF